MRRYHNHNTERRYYWIAVNGASCALSRIPATDIRTVPVASNYWGFPTLEEAEAAQRLLLTATASDMGAAIRSWHQREDIALVVERDPDPPTHGPTLWSFENKKGE